MAVNGSFQIRLARPYQGVGALADAARAAWGESAALRVEQLTGDDDRVHWSRTHSDIRVWIHPTRFSPYAVGYLSMRLVAPTIVACEFVAMPGADSIGCVPKFVRTVHSGFLLVWFIVVLVSWGEVPLSRTVEAALLGVAVMIAGLTGIHTLERRLIKEVPSEDDIRDVHDELRRRVIAVFAGEDRDEDRDGLATVRQAARSEKLR